MSEGRTAISFITVVFSLISGRIAISCVFLMVFVLAISLWLNMILDPSSGLSLVLGGDISLVGTGGLCGLAPGMLLKYMKLASGARLGCPRHAGPPRRLSSHWSAWPGRPGRNLV